MMKQYLGFGDVYVPSRPMARLMNQNGVQGRAVTDKLLAKITAEAKAEDKGKAARLERAAKMVVTMK